MISITLDCYVSVTFPSAPARTSQRIMSLKRHLHYKVRTSSSNTQYLSNYSQNRNVSTNFVKILNMKLLSHGNPSGGSRVVPTGKTDMTRLKTLFASPSPQNKQTKKLVSKYVSFKTFLLNMLRSSYTSNRLVFRTATPPLVLSTRLTAPLDV